ncbi:hypothetical protein GOP47_0028171 [Adiantum capillus-veneris]|nr:hypothetical protein GOP47_0028171 [Adiantum capillus-veneris]
MAVCSFPKAPCCPASYLVTFSPKQGHPKLHNLSPTSLFKVGASTPPCFLPDVGRSSASNLRQGLRISSCMEPSQGALPLQTVRIHYHRKFGDYENWGLHVWGAVKAPTSWESPLFPSGEDDFGVYWDIEGYSDDNLNFLVHQGNLKDCGGSIQSFDAASQQLWLVSETDEVFSKKPDLAKTPKGSLKLARAYWVKENLVAWPSSVEGAEFYLHASKSANLLISGSGVEGSDSTIKLDKVSGLPIEVVYKFPHIKSYIALRIPSPFDVKELVKCQLAIAMQNADGGPLDVSGVQLPGVLDDVFSYDGPLGPLFTEEGVSLSVWAPTSQRVKLLLYSSPSGDEPIEVVDLHEEKGVWTVRGPKTWRAQYYLFQVEVFHPLTQKIETSLANDPYSRGLSANGERSLLVDLNDPELQPTGWTELGNQKPILKSFTDISIYELHIRDFSIADESVDSLFQGTYLAFTSQTSRGVKHLKELADAGLTHIHLLPSFDFASVDEVKENWKSVDSQKLAAFPTDSDKQQAVVVAIQNEDGYNWGYDPVNWGVPEGSYSTDPSSSKRCLEFRQMIQAINCLGLRVVLDVVYNHLHGNGPHDNYSVLDKVVPGYYLRLNTDGQIENSTCMNNTASEHYMVDRLIVDDIRHWAVDYKVDGFRFDLMGHLMKSTMLRAKDVLQSLSVDQDGIDGSKIYLYGEGWDFGEVARNGRGENASQSNLAGTEIGSFNDRIRDSAIGGSPFADPRQQGFLTGLYLQPNGFDQGDEEALRNALAATTDWIRVGLVGNLKDFSFLNYQGKQVTGEEVLTHDGRPVAYAKNPVETINYVSAHDNETLFDVIMLKTARSVTLKERCRINSLASSIIALSQGIPFYHAGDDILRSKSLDRDSYNSGDWFNRLDFTYESNNWGIGLPPKEKNGSKWNFMRDLLSDKSLRASKADILLAKENFRVFLKIRYSTPLFCLPTSHDIQERVKFHCSGPYENLGVIVMSIEDGIKDQNHLKQLDDQYQTVVVIFNACPKSVSFDVPFCKSKTLILHPLQESSSDEMTKQQRRASQHWVTNTLVLALEEGKSSYFGITGHSEQDSPIIAGLPIHPLDLSNFSCPQSIPSFLKKESWVSDLYFEPHQGNSSNWNFVIKDSIPEQN